MVLGGCFVLFNIFVSDLEEREYEYGLLMILIFFIYWNIKLIKIYFKILLLVWVGRNLIDKRGKCKVVFFGKISKIIII